MTRTHSTYQLPGWVILSQTRGGIYMGSSGKHPGTPISDSTRRHPARDQLQRTTRRHGDKDLTTLPPAHAKISPPASACSLFKTVVQQRRHESPRRKRTKRPVNRALSILNLMPNPTAISTASRSVRVPCRFARKRRSLGVLYQLRTRSVRGIQGFCDPARGWPTNLPK